MIKVTPSTDANHFLDITSDVCPMTFVRTKLLMEKMASGERAEIRLQGAEPLDNVPKSVREIGHVVVSLVREDASGPEDGPHRLVLQKT